jgi:hypothetical protein
LLRRERLAETYLDHIIIGVGADDRGAPYRTFIDNWYAFETGAGHLTKSDRPIWFNNPCAYTHHGALSAMHFISHAAREVLAHAVSNRPDYLRLRSADDKAIRLMVDHAVPLRVITEMLFRPQFELTRENVLRHLKRWYRLGVITSAEDALINSMGLRSKMPDQWDEQDCFARYRAVGVLA